MFATSESSYSLCSSCLVHILHISCSASGSQIFLNIPPICSVFPYPSLSSAIFHFHTLQLVSSLFYKFSGYMEGALSEVNVALSVTLTFHVSLVLKVERHWSCTSTRRPRLVAQCSESLMRGLRVFRSVLCTFKQTV